MHARAHTHTSKRTCPSNSASRSNGSIGNSFWTCSVSVRDIQGLPFHFPLPVLDPSNQSQPEEKRQVRDTGRCAFSKGAGCLWAGGSDLSFQKLFLQEKEEVGVGHLLSFHRILPLLHEFWNVNNHFKTCGVLSVVQEKTRRWLFKTMHVDGVHVKPLCWE